MSLDLNPVFLRVNATNLDHEHQVPNPDSNLDHIPHGRGGLHESGFESSLPPCKRNQSGSGSGSESPCKRGYSVLLSYNPVQNVWVK